LPALTPACFFQEGCCRNIFLSYNTLFLHDKQSERPFYLCHNVAYFSIVLILIFTVGGGGENKEHLPKDPE